MNQPFLNAVDTEVLAVQRRLTAYAKKHPKIAARLRLGHDVTSDPHVGRLIQSYALLVARTRCRIEDAFPEIIEPLIAEAGYPQLQPQPSVAIAELGVDPEQPPDNTGITVPRGSELQAEPVDDREAQFQTCADTRFWPLQVTDTAIVLPPFTGTDMRVSRASCALQISLATMAGNIALNEIEADSLRFYIDEEQTAALRIYEALFQNSTGIQIVSDHGEHGVLSPQSLRRAGFSPAEQLLDSTGQPDGERLLSELALLPEKFLFFEITDLRRVLRQVEGTTVVLNILLDDPASGFPDRIEHDALKLGCVPVINLFTTTTEPVEVSPAKPDIALITDSRSHGGDQIHHVSSVGFRGEDEAEREIPPLHGSGSQTTRQHDGVYWVLLPDSQTTLRLVSLSGHPAAADQGVVVANVVCSNGNMPVWQASRDQWPRLQPLAPGIVTAARILTKPTQWKAAASIDKALKLIGRRVTLPDATSSSETQDITSVIREVLRTAFEDSDNTLAQIGQSITQVQVQRVTGIHHRRVVCHGLEIRVMLDDLRTVTGGICLFADILRRLLAWYATQSTFVKFDITTTSGRKYGPWPTIAGERCNI